MKWIHKKRREKSMAAPAQGMEISDGPVMLSA
jgi:hypothetical protein